MNMASKADSNSSRTYDRNYSDEQQQLEEKMAQFALSELLRNEEFKNLWAEMAFDMEQEEAANPLNRFESPQIEGSQADSVSSDELIKPISPKDQSHKLLLEIFTQLDQGLKLAIETFLRGSSLFFNISFIFSAQMAYYCSSQPNGLRKPSRESASFYSVQIQVERLRNSAHYRPAQIGLVGRSIEKALRQFTNFISTPYCIENCVFLASTLLDMLAKFIDHCSLFEQPNDCTDEIYGFCRRIEKFEQIKLSSVRDKAQKRRRSVQSNLPLHRTQSMLDVTVQNSRVVLLPFSPKRNRNTPQRSFLMAPELELERTMAANNKKSKHIQQDESKGKAMGKANAENVLLKELFLSGTIGPEERKELMWALRTAKESIDTISRQNKGIL